MAGRCGCSSSNATGASLAAGSACVSVTGAGTPASPAEIDVVVDPSAANNLQCGVSGLFSATAQLESGGDCLTVVGDGSLATPYVADVVVSPSAGNMLECEADGLYAKPNPIVVLGSATLLGGGLPPDPNYVIEAGSHVGTTDASGHIIVPIYVDLLGIVTIETSLGDVPLILSNMAQDNSLLSLTQFVMVFQATDGSGPIVGSSYRINYEILGWYA